MYKIAADLCAAQKTWMSRVVKSMLLCVKCTTIKTCENPTVPNPRFGAKRQLVSNVGSRCQIFRIRKTQGLNWPKMPILWVPAPGKEAPSDAVPGGIDVNGTRIYVARAPHMGSLIPGKWRAACCWVR